MGVMHLRRNAFDSQTAGLALARTIGRSGLRPPTLQTIAEEAKTGVSTLHRWFGGTQGMLPHATAAFADMFWTRIADRVNATGWAGFLPANEDDLFFLRAWLGFEDLARYDDGVGQAVGELWHDARFWFRSVLGRELTEFELAGVEAILRGLWDALSAAEPLDADLAHRVWDAAYRFLAELPGNAAAA
jgi:AcrR family transcriptional regulator